MTDKRNDRTTDVLKKVEKRAIQQYNNDNTTKQTQELETTTRRLKIHYATPKTLSH